MNSKRGVVAPHHSLRKHTSSLRLEVAAACRHCRGRNKRDARVPKHIPRGTDLRGPRRHQQCVADGRLLWRGIGGREGRHGSASRSVKHHTRRINDTRRIRGSGSRWRGQKRQEGLDDGCEALRLEGVCVGEDRVQVVHVTHRPDSDACKQHGTDLSVEHLLIPSRTCTVTVTARSLKRDCQQRNISRIEEGKELCSCHRERPEARSVEPVLQSTNIYCRRQHLSRLQGFNPCIDLCHRAAVKPFSLCLR